MLPTDTAALIQHLVDHFHEAHRRELPRLVALARVLEGPQGAVGTLLEDLAQDLEAHMFKEEMRLFPMIEQGGGTLVGHLVDDMQREHRQQGPVLDHLAELMAAWQPDDVAAEAQQALRRGVARFVDGLREHMRIEDEILFAPFASAPRPLASIG